MKVFASWSGGKDCMMATYREIIKGEHEVVSLLNMCEADGKASRSHGLSNDMLVAQAQAIDISLLQIPIGTDGYRPAYIRAIEDLKKQGVTGAVFGDIYLQAHRDWLEEVCHETGLTPIFPLWQEDTAQLLKFLIDEGFKAVTVAIDPKKLSDEWLNRPLDYDFYRDILTLDHIDPCAEQGEYHTFVFDGPIFKHPVSFKTTDVFSKDNNKFIRLTLHDKINP